MRPLCLLLLLLCSSCHGKVRPTLKEDCERRLEANWKAHDSHGVIDCLNYLIRLDTTNGEYYFKRGVCYSAIGDRKKATADLERAIRMDSNVAAAHARLGDLAEVNLEFGEALREYKIAKRLAPADPILDLNINFCLRRLQPQIEPPEKIPGRPGL